MPFSTELLAVKAGVTIAATDSSSAALLEREAKATSEGELTRVGTFAIDLDHDLADRRQRSAARQQAHERAAGDTRALPDDEIVGRFDLGPPGAFGARRRGDQAVGVAGAEEERVGDRWRDGKNRE
jgi:hypothetical protein